MKRGHCGLGISLPRGGTGYCHVALLLTVVVLAATTVPAGHAFASWTVDPTSRTTEQTRAMWEQLRPRYAGAAYAVASSVTAPYAPGSLQPGFMIDGLNIINFGRYLAGLPYDVTLDSTRNLDSQYGAVLLAASTFSHEPPKPADMDQTFYDRGLASTSSSNIGWGHASAVHFQTTSLYDSDPNNIARLGHRRWLLNPSMRITGLGYAVDTQGKTRHVTYAFDQSRAEPVDYTAITWPSPGLFPVEFFNTQTAWSITLNPNRYDWDSTGQTVILKRLFDGRTWTFDATDKNTSGEYFNAEFSRFGVPNAFIFRPDPATVAYFAGNEFEVTLRGGIYAEGTRTPATVSYRTTFMTLTPTTRMAVYRFYNLMNGTHFYTPSDSERDSVIAKWPGVYKYEGVAYSVDPASNSQPLYRFYNRRLGSHFYTASLAERDSVIQRFADVYAYEGETYKVSTTPAPGNATVYRFYNKKNGSHFFTASESEKSDIIAKYGATYQFEGPAFWLGQ